MVFKISLIKLLVFVFPYLFSSIKADKLESRFNFKELEKYLRQETSNWKEVSNTLMSELKKFEIDVRRTDLEMYETENSIRDKLFKDKSVISLKKSLLKFNEEKGDIKECYLLLNENMSELIARLNKQIYARVKNYANALEIDIPLIKKILSTAIEKLESDSEDNIQLCKQKFPACYVPSYWVMTANMLIDRFNIYKIQFNDIKKQTNDSLTDVELSGYLRYTVIKPVEECYRRKRMV